MQPVATEVNQGAGAALHIAMTSIQKIHLKLQTVMMVPVSTYRKYEDLLMSYKLHSDNIL